MGTTPCNKVPESYSKLRGVLWLGVHIQLLWTHTKVNNSWTFITWNNVSTIPNCMLLMHSTVIISTSEHYPRRRSCSLIILMLVWYLCSAHYCRTLVLINACSSIINNSAQSVYSIRAFCLIMSTCSARWNVIVAILWLMVTIDER